MPKHKTPGTRQRFTREKTRTRILDVAEELFADRNPRDVTIREIAEKAGVTHPLVHQYVGTKDDLLDAVIQRVAIDRTSIVKQSESLNEAVQTLVQQVLHNRVHSKTLVRAAMDDIPHESAEARIPTGRALIELARVDAETTTDLMPAPNDIDPRVVLAAISALAYGWVASEKLALPSFDLEAEDQEEVYRQLGQIAAYLQNLIHASER